MKMKIGFAMFTVVLATQSVFADVTILKSAISGTGFMMPTGELQIVYPTLQVGENKAYLGTEDDTLGEETATVACKMLGKKFVTMQTGPADGLKPVARKNGNAYDYKGKKPLAATFDVRGTFKVREETFIITTLSCK